MRHRSFEPTPGGLRPCDCGAHMLRWDALRGHPPTVAAVYTPPVSLDGLRPQTVAVALAALLLPPLLLLGKKTGGPASFGAASGLWMGFLLRGGPRGPLAGLLRALVRFNAAGYAQERGARWAALRGVPAHDWVCVPGAPPRAPARGARGRAGAGPRTGLTGPAPARGAGSK